MSIAQRKKVLIITSSCGGGHLQLAVAKEQEVREEDPDSYICTRDVMKDWVWKPFGWFLIEVWNGSQRKGFVSLQSVFCAMPSIANVILWPYFFFSSLRLIFKENIDRVIDTQCFGTSATIKAIRIFNKVRNKSVYLEKVFSDLPTKKANHFFWPIRQLSQNDQRYLKLIAIDPLLEVGQSPEEFWKVNCNLPLSKLEYQYFYVRKAFKKFLHKQRSPDIGHLKISYKSEQELGLMLESINRGSANYQITNGLLELKIEPTHRVYTILLGLQMMQQSITSKHSSRWPKTIRKCLHTFLFTALNTTLRSRTCLREPSSSLSKWKTTHLP
jgi:hypothetical protein